MKLFLSCDNVIHHYSSDKYHCMTMILFSTVLYYTPIYTIYPCNCHMRHVLSSKLPPEIVLIAYRMKCEHINKLVK